MAKSIIELKDLRHPEDLVTPQEDGTYEQYKKDGIYGYRLLPNGKKDKSFAKITYNEGDVYEGNLKHGKYSGAGKYYWKDGGIYEGNFSKGQLSGEGKYTAGNGEAYEGNFKNDNYDGQGKYTWEDGSFFEGTFKDGKLIAGKYTDASGNVYDCKFNYKRNGESKNSVIRLLHAAKHTENHEEKKQQKKQAAQNNGLQNKDKTLIAAIKKSKRGAEFKNLYSGAAGKSEKSEKDLITILNFFSNSDADQIQRIFKSSEIYDPTKGQEHLRDMVTGVIKRSTEFTKSMKVTSNNKQAANGSTKNASKGAAR